MRGFDEKAPLHIDAGSTKPRRQNGLPSYAPVGTAAARPGLAIDIYRPISNIPDTPWASRPTRSVCVTCQLRKWGIGSPRETRGAGSHTSPHRGQFFSQDYKDVTGFPVWGCVWETQKLHVQRPLGVEIDKLSSQFCGLYVILRSMWPSYDDRRTPVRRVHLAQLSAPAPSWAFCLRSGFGGGAR